ncbi:hypothetical protein [Oceanicoccus sp. KOV_DT_Chl]|uniref:hypothetical protein n=1 Tax=Oceanicoccus sp. KOV_DT_Chl TaxID=1904639 RepID=UPI001F2BB6B4|nr:hypothetical protein [Oceanicoccus sp. KOV_DT_Chl]
MGMLSDGLAASHGEHSIRYALGWSLLTILIGVLFYYLASRHYGRALQQAQQAAAK